MVGLPQGSISKYDVYKIVQRMGYQITLHRMIDICSATTHLRSTLSGINGLDGSEADFGAKDLTEFLSVIEHQVFGHLEFKYHSTQVDKFFMVIKGVLLYMTLASIVLMGLKVMWVDGDYGWIINCIPILSKKQRNLFAIFSSLTR